IKGGGTVWYDYQIEPVYNPLRPRIFALDEKAGQPAPAWLRQIFGDDFFREAVHVMFDEVSIPESTLAHLAKLSDVESITILDSKIISPGSIAQRPVCDSDLIVLGRLPRLTGIWIKGAELDGSWLERMAGTSGLAEVSLEDMPIDDRSMKYLCATRSLKQLNLHGTRISEAGFRYIADATNLELLMLSSTNISSSEPYRNLKHVT